MLTFSNISVTRGGKAVLTHVTLGLPPGKITVLLGKNGTGKSTLLGCVNGTVPYQGRILLGDTDIATLSPRLRARQIGMLPQLLPDTMLTVADLVALGRTPHTGGFGHLSDADRTRVAEAMDLAGVGAFAHRSVGTLSGGEKQRAYLAMLLAQDTPLLCLDEPGTYLDTDARRELYGLLAALAGEKTILVVMHDLSEAAALGDYAAVLREGEMAFFGMMEECVESHILENSFGVAQYVVEKNGERRVFFG